MKCGDWLFDDDEQFPIAVCNRDENHSGWHADGPWNWEQDPCPHCGAKEPKIECGAAPGFTGAAITWATYCCCGEQEVDDSADCLEAVR
jgi:hypothetical protein